MYSDIDIERAIEKGHIGYTPWDEKYLNPASIDMTLHPVVRWPKPLGTFRTIFGGRDMREVPADHTSKERINAKDGLFLPRGAFILACTNERVTLPDDIVARVEGKSSVGRVGLAVHITAGFIDPGFDGQVTLEIANLAPWPLILWPGMRIAQIAFQPTVSPALKPYGEVGHYQGQEGPTESRYKIRD